MASDGMCLGMFVSGFMDWATTYDHGDINIDPLLYICIYIYTDIMDSWPTRLALIGLVDRIAALCFGT